MFTWILKRVTNTSRGTFGVLIDENYIPFLLTLEPPWMNNVHEISCIPMGSYKCQRTHHPKHGECFQVMNVENRSDILFHQGNTIKDTEGCIILGKEFGYLYDKSPAILMSLDAVNGIFIRRLKDINEFNLRIIECPI